MELNVGMRIARKSKNPSASNLAEVVEVYGNGQVRLQHLEGGKRQTICDTKSVQMNWKLAPDDAPTSTEVRIAALENAAPSVDARLGAVERKLAKLLAALGEALSFHLGLALVDRNGGFVAAWRIVTPRE